MAGVLFRNQRSAVLSQKVADDDKISTYVLWGRRNRVSFISGLLSMSAIIACPLLVLFLYISLEHFDGSVVRAGLGMYSATPFAFFQMYWPRINRPAITWTILWVIFQSLMYTFLPGNIVKGPPTPAGNTLPYKTNGLASWCVTTGIFVLITCTLGLKAAAALADNWGPVLLVANYYGVAVTVVAWIKAHIWPSDTRDLRHSGSVFHDIFSGIELNPRAGRLWDLKLVQIGRIGMNSWTIIELSFAAKQYLGYGFLTNSMIIVIVLHGIYVIDYFVNENWYLGTIDIAHDHFGFCLAWGPAAWLPMIYTSQAQYLATHPVHLNSALFWGILGMGVTGYAFFRLSNHQKHLVREASGNCLIAGKRPLVIRSKYSTGSGRQHTSFLLYSGCWGIARHPNYLGDIVFSLASCVCCGWTHAFPYTYFLYMTLLLVHRSYRDETRCSAKHGKAWIEYKKLVKWRIFPGIF